MYKFNLSIPSATPESFFVDAKLANNLSKRYGWKVTITVSNSMGLHPFIAKCREEKGWKYWDEIAEMAENQYHNL